MKIHVFSLLDVKIGSYGMPFFLNHPHGAVRACIELCNANDNVVSRHPADFALYHIAMFDDATGLFEPLDFPKHLGMVNSFLPPPHPTLPLKLTPDQQFQEWQKGRPSELIVRDEVIEHNRRKKLEESGPMPDPAAQLNGEAR